MQQEKQKKQLHQLMHSNFGKGNLVDGVLSLLLSSENLVELDKLLISLFSEISEFDVLVDGLEHQRANPSLYAEDIREDKTEPAADTQLETLRQASQKLKSIQMMIKRTKHAIEKDKSNLAKVHDIYTDKFKKRVQNSATHLNEQSKRILMESLMNSQNRSVLNVQKKKAGTDQPEPDEPDSAEQSFKTISEKTENVKKIFERVTPEQKKAIIESLELRKKIMESWVREARLTGQEAEQAHGQVDPAGEHSAEAAGDGQERQLQQAEGARARAGRVDPAEEHHQRRARPRPEGARARNAEVQRRAGAGGAEPERRRRHDLRDDDGHSAAARRQSHLLRQRHSRWTHQKFPKSPSAPICRSRKSGPTPSQTSRLPKRSGPCTAQ